MGVADDYVGDGRRCDACLFEGFIRREKICHMKIVNPVLPVRTGVEEDCVAAAANHPEDHGDVCELILRRAHHEGVEWKLRDSGVADCVD